MLSPDQVRQREGLLTASRVACLMTGDETDILNLWKELIGDPSFAPEDLSGIWAVQLGSWTEPLNLDWFERKHGPLSKRGEVIKHENGWAACTLDGWSDLHGCPVECKHVGGREDLSVIVERYQAQMHWQMIVTGANRCALSVISGAGEPTVDFIDKDEPYATELWQRAHAFMLCVDALTPPCAVAPVAAPVKAEKTYDMQGNNAWGANAATWASTRQAKKDCDAAEKELKAAVPADAVRCFGYGIEIRRDRAGRLSLKEKVS